MTPILGLTFLFLLFAGFGIAWAWFGPKEEAAQIGEAVASTVNGALSSMARDFLAAANDDQDQAARLAEALDRDRKERHKGLVYGTGSYAGRYVGD